MFRPEDPLKPRDAVFDEAWHAQTLALADTMIQAGILSAEDWAVSLGSALKQADSEGKPDNTDTYYHCALAALENLVADGTTIDPVTLSKRKETWERAYLATPHGEPVELKAGEF